MECWKCKLKLVYNVNSKLVQCCYCNALNGVVNPSETTQVAPFLLSNPSNLTPQYQIVQCVGCGISLRASENAFAVSCPYCSALTSLL